MLTTSSVTTSTRLLRANNLLYNQYSLIDYNVKKCSYNEHPPTMNTFLCIKLLVIKGTHCSWELKSSVHFCRQIRNFFTIHKWVECIPMALNIIKKIKVLLTKSDECDSKCEQSLRPNRIVRQNVCISLQLPQLVCYQEEDNHPLHPKTPREVLQFPQPILLLLLPPRPPPPAPPREQTTHQTQREPPVVITKFLVQQEDRHQPVKVRKHWLTCFC